VPIIVVAGLAVCVALLARWRAEYVAHRRRVDALAWRVHVNGIRGKSTVTRIIAGMMREAGLTTIAKSTGTFAAVINDQGVDEPIDRKGPPTILEQIEIARKYVNPGVDALVIECMALKPEYQEVSERMIVRSNIGVLTNVREDHQDVMGETLPEIARSLLSTCPTNGILITSDQNPEILEVMREVCASKRSELIVADPARVTDEENQGFDYISFKENVTIALTIADIVGIPRDVAIRGMIKAEPDPGVLRMKELAIGGKKVTWANLFAVNDRESMVAAMEKLTPFQTDETITIGILNNRSDRERRAIQFADVAVHDLVFDRLVTFGAFEGLVTDRLKANGYPTEHILNLGDEHHATQDEIIRRMIIEQPSSHVLVVGFVNIHTHQAEEMLEYFEHEAAVWEDDAAADAAPTHGDAAGDALPQRRAAPAESPPTVATEPADDWLPRRRTTTEAPPGEPTTLPSRPTTTSDHDGRGDSAPALPRRGG
jgi:poly-gamma-glutamate synthase PgsB/CapB